MSSHKKSLSDFQLWVTKKLIDHMHRFAGSKSVGASDQMSTVDIFARALYSAISPPTPAARSLLINFTGLQCDVVISAPLQFSDQGLISTLDSPLMPWKANMLQDICISLSSNTDAQYWNSALLLSAMSEHIAQRLCTAYLCQEL